MIFKLQVDPSREEEVLATVHKRTPLIDEIEKLVLEAGSIDKLPGYTEDEITMLALDDIECFLTESDRTYAVSGGKRFLIKKRLSELEGALPGQFVRISKSAIANWNKAARLKVQLSGAVDIVFKSGYTDYISRRCFAELKRRFDL